MNPILGIALGAILMTIGWFIYAFADTIWAEHIKPRLVIHSSTPTTYITALQPEVDWRTERRQRRASQLNDWDRQYQSLLPPPEPCTSTEHDHIEITTFGGQFGGQIVRRICNGR